MYTHTPWGLTGISLWNMQAMPLTEASKNCGFTGIPVERVCIFMMRLLHRHIHVNHANTSHGHICVECAATHDTSEAHPLRESLPSICVPHGRDKQDIPLLRM